MPRTTVRDIRSSLFPADAFVPALRGRGRQDSCLGEVQPLIVGDGEPIGEEPGHGPVELRRIGPGGRELGSRHRTVRGPELPHDEPANLPVGSLEAGL